MWKHILLVGLLSFSTLPLLKAQSCGNDEKYHLPYKNTYVKDVYKRQALRFKLIGAIRLTQTFLISYRVTSRI